MNSSMFKHCLLLLLLYCAIIFSDSVQRSLEKKFCREGPIPILPSEDFAKKIAVRMNITVR